MFPVGFLIYSRDCSATFKKIIIGLLAFISENSGELSFRVLEKHLILVLS